MGAISIDLESDHLIMRGMTTGCVLRGVLNLHLKQPIKVKSIELVFTGWVKVDWKEPRKNGHEQHFHTDNKVLEHCWQFLPPHYEKLHTLPAGHHTYDFELPLTPDLPQSSKVASFYRCQYDLKATVHRPYLLPNLVSHRPVQVIRLLGARDASSTMSVSNQWRNKLAYEISLPTRHFHHGEVMPVTIRLIPLSQRVVVSQINCTLMEVASCKPIDGRFGGKTKTHGRIVHYTRKSGGGGFEVNLAIPVPATLDDIQYDTKSPSVEIQHKLKFVLSIVYRGKKLIELQAVLPVIIQPKPLGLLPTYEQSSDQSFPYTPALMMALLRRHSSPQEGPSALPTYDQVPLCS